MGKDGGAGEYPTTKSDSNLWGSSITSGNGITFRPTDWQTSAMDAVSKNMTPTINEYLNPTYSSEEYQKTKEQFNKQAKESYDSNVLSQLAEKGLMRSSGLQSATNSFNNTLAENEAELMNKYKQTKLTDLSTLLGLSTDLYNYSQGENKLSSTLSNNVANYNLQNQVLKNKASENRNKLISDGIATAADIGLMFI